MLTDASRAPTCSGVYFFDAVSGLLRATDHLARGDSHSFSPQQISGWARKGFARVGVENVFSKRRFIRFPDLITLRMVAILRSHGISLAKTKMAHDYLVEALSIPSPFVNRALWVDDADIAEDIFANVDEMLITASRHGQLPFTQLLKTKIVDAANMTYDDNDNAATWSPQEGIVIDPQIHSGSPCIEGTRIATNLLASMHGAGDSVAELADWYELDATQVQSALDWEDRLAA